MPILHQRERISNWQSLFIAAINSYPIYVYGSLKQRHAVRLRYQGSKNSAGKDSMAKKPNLTD